MNLLFHGDCIEIMKSLPDKSIDLCLTDPPYGTTACKWDTVIPFEPMWEQLKRICKDNAAICLFGSEPFSSHLRISNLKMFKYDWVWIKSRKFGFFSAKLRPLSSNELISVFSSSKTSPGNKNNMKYFPQGLISYRRIVNGIKTTSKSKDSHRLSRPSHKARYFREFNNYPHTVLHFNSVVRGIHPTQKPIQLLEYLIKTYTLENETVLDFTMGSGSTGVACKNLKRQFIGIEKDKEYFDIAKKRIEEHVVQENML